MRQTQVRWEPVPNIRLRELDLLEGHQNPGAAACVVLVLQVIIHHYGNSDKHMQLDDRSLKTG